VSDIIVSCHLCLKQVEVTQTRIVMAEMNGLIIPLGVERLKRMWSEKPQRWVRICLACNKQREEA